MRAVLARGSIPLSSATMNTSGLELRPSRQPSTSRARETRRFLATKPGRLNLSSRQPTPPGWVEIQNVPFGPAWHSRRPQGRMPRIQRYIETCNESALVRKWSYAIHRGELLAA